MKIKLLLSAVLCVALSGGSAEAARTLAQADSLARATLSQMTLDEKLMIIDGSVFDIKPVERLGIKRIHMSDGPIGVRQGRSTAYPAAVMLAATWNRDLAHRYGYALGRDSRARGINIILGPAVNIYRSPLNSRNFEYMGEDPYLASQMSGRYIVGVQENPGVIACIKHFAANNPESGRYDVSSDVDERTLHEIYLPVFRNAVEVAGVGSIMSSYNRINGTWTSENKWLMHDVLRDMWHFPFLTMTDWGAAHHSDKIVKYGVDLEMPGGEVMTAEKVAPLLTSGEVVLSDIDKKVFNILRTCYYFNLYDHTAADTSIPLDDPASVATAYDVAKEGVVLLKNNGLLPLSADVKRICITGHNARRYVSGGGSSCVEPNHEQSFADALVQAGRRHGVEVVYEDVELNPDVTKECCYVDKACRKPGFAAKYYKGMAMEGKPFVARTESELHTPWSAKAIGNHNTETPFSARYTTQVAVAEAGDYIFSVSGDDGFRMTVGDKTVVDDWHDGVARIHTYRATLTPGEVYPVVIEYYQNGGGSSLDFKVNRVDPNGRERVKHQFADYDLVVVCEGFDKNLESEGGDRTFALDSDREGVIAAVADCDVASVAIINAGGNVDSQGWIDGIDGLLWAWYAGQEGGRAVADILFGDANPSGKLPMTFERRAEDNPTFTTYSDQGHKHVAWTEGVFVGYRGYEKRGVEPLYPFGYGLSYTTFELSGLSVATASDGTVSVGLDVTNSGNRSGAEVVQLYVGKSDESPVLRPAKELKGFEKVTLAPGEQQRVTLTLTADAFRYFDVNTHSWVDDPGDYRLMVGTSSVDIRLSETIRR